MYILLLGNQNSQTLLEIFAYLNKTKSEDILWFSNKDIVNKLVVDDAIDPNGKTRLSWEIDGYHLSTTNVLGIINNLDYLEDVLFEDFQEEDRKYAQSEYNAYLLFSLSQFKNILNPPWGGNLSGSCHSLPYQWLLVRQLNSNIKIPIHYFGFPNNVSAQLTSNLNTVISKNIFDTRHWLTDEVDLSNIDYPVLFYERPTGTPVLISVLDDIYWAKDLYSDAHVQINKDEWSLVLNLMNFFHLRMASILIFYSKDKITFGSIEPGIDINLLPQSQNESFLVNISKKVYDNAPKKS
jgi:hypothetical protein